MTQLKQSLETTSIERDENVATAATENNSMEEYYQLQKFLWLTTIALTGVIFIPIWIFYSLNVALNYTLGACVGVVYLRMLGSDVEKIGKEKKALGSRRLGVFALLIIVASQWHQLHVLPVFLGFLTYKAAIIVYTIRSFSSSRS